MPKSQTLLKGPLGRVLMVAEVATLVGGGVIYYQVRATSSPDTFLVATRAFHDCLSNGIR